MDGSQGENDAAYWRERAEQLQHALTSRIAIEQSKGVLAERLGLDMEGAFALLRYAARGARMKLHDLALAVVENDETPEEVVHAIARHADTLARVPRAQRIVQTETFFRAVNEEIASLEGQVFLCECGNPACMAAITLTRDSLARLHNGKNTFVVLKGHELPDVETVIAAEDGYLIVRKEQIRD
jgi:hemin uptake protein HemP